MTGSWQAGVNNALGSFADFSEHVSTSQPLSMEDEGAIPTTAMWGQ